MWLVIAVVSAGPFIADIEAVALGQAGAYVASPETLAAFWYNPAALADQSGLRVELEGGLNYAPLSFTRASDDAGSYRTVRNAAPLLPAVFAAASYDFAVPDLAAGIAFYSPSSVNTVLPSNGPQRYQAIVSDSTLLHLHAGVAYRPLRWLSFGATLGNTFFSAKQVVAISASPLGDESPDFAVPITIDVQQALTFTCNLGVRVTPLPQLAIGVSVSPPFDVDARGTVTFALPAALSEVRVRGDRVRLQLKMPTIARAGVRYAPIPQLSVELSAVFEQWSRTKNVRIVPDVEVSAPAFGMSASALEPIVQERHYKDSISVRLGVSARPVRRLSVRAGYAIETSAVEHAWFDITAPDALKHIVTTGMSFDVWKLSIDVAYAHVFAPAVHVSDSQIGLTPVLTESDVVVGNGVYRFSADAFHLGLRAHFL